MSKNYWEIPSQPLPNQNSQPPKKKPSFRSNHTPRPQRSGYHKAITRLLFFFVLVQLGVLIYIHGSLPRTVPYLPSINSHSNESQILTDVKTVYEDFKNNYPKDIAQYYVRLWSTEWSYKRIVSPSSHDKKSLLKYRVEHFNRTYKKVYEKPREVSYLLIIGHGIMLLGSLLLLTRLNGLYGGVFLVGGGIVATPPFIDAVTNVWVDAQFFSIVLPGFFLFLLILKSMGDAFKQPAPASSRRVTKPNLKAKGFGGIVIGIIIIALINILKILLKHGF